MTAAGISASAQTQGAGDPLQVDVPAAMVQPRVRERHHKGAPLDRCHPHTWNLGFADAHVNDDGLSPK